MNAIGLMPEMIVNNESESSSLLRNRNNPSDGFKKVREITGKKCNPVISNCPSPKERDREIEAILKELEQEKTQKYVEFR